MEVQINSSPAQNPGLGKRLLFIITQSEFGGAQQFLFQLLGHIQKNGHDIHVAIGSDGDASLLKAVGSMHIAYSVIHDLKRNPDPWYDLAAVWRTRKLINTFKPDTLFLLSSKAGFIGSLAARFSKKRPNVVYRIGGWTFNDPQPTWRKNLWIFLERLSAPWKDIIVVNNAHDLRQAQELAIVPRDRVVLVHNGIDPFRLNLLPRDEARIRLTRTIPTSHGINLEQKKLIGTIANFYPTKGLRYLIEAAAHVTDPNAVFCIIGDGEERPALEKRIAELNLGKKVLLLGRLPEASQYLLAFDVFVLSSVKEGFPWVVLEAMSAKLPVVATRVGAIPEIIDTETNGYIVEPGDAEQLAERINTLLRNELAAHEMGIQAHQKILFSFTLDAMIKQIEQLL